MIVKTKLWSIRQTPWASGLSSLCAVLAFGMLLSSTDEAHSQSRQNFSTWQDDDRWDANQRKRRRPNSSNDRGFFNSLFSPRRRLSRGEIRARLSDKAPAKPRFFVYKPEPLVALAKPGSDVPSSQDPIRLEVHRLLTTSAEPALLTWKRQAEAIRQFYKERDFEPVWIDRSGFKTKTLKLLSALARSSAEGLDPNRYLPSSLNSFKDTGPRSADNKEALARLELELSLAAIAYTRHASAGQVAPSKIGRDMDVHPKEADPANAFTSLSKSSDPGEFLKSLLPSHPAYRQLRMEYVKLRATANSAQSVPRIPDGSVLKVGQTDRRVPIIRQRLVQMGLLGELKLSLTDEPVDHNDSVNKHRFSEDRRRLAVIKRTYDAGMALAVKDFQGSRKLARDGIIGRRTIAALNSPAGGSITNRIEKLKFALERMKWMPRKWGQRHIMVNQPEYRARVIVRNAITHEMRVVIGKKRFPTAEFSDEMEYVAFNPYWNVPRSIAGNEMLPKLWNDPGYLDRAGYEVRDRRGKRVSSNSVDWWNYTGRTMPYDIRQLPGRSNALGAVKFMFPNKHAIYLHDTPAKNLFKKLTRAYSHGCVRVQTPRKFAEIVLGWGRGEVNAAIESGRNQRVNLKRKIPVHLTYFTAWPDRSGRIKYYEDVYDRDAALRTALSRELSS